MNAYTKTSKRILAILLAVAMVLSNLPGYSLALEAAATETSSSSSTSTVVTTDTSSSTTSTEADAQRIADITEIVNMHLKYGYAAWGSSVYTYDTDPDIDSADGYTDAGTLSDQSLQEGLDTLKMVRYLAGVDYEDIAFTTTANEGAQLAAYVNALNDEMNHDPAQPDGMTDELFATANAAASASNLAYGYDTPAASILVWIEDTGDSNIDNVGHRRWLLADSNTNYGLGAAVSTSGTTYSAAYVKEENSSNVTADYVAWPSSGTFPIQYFVNEWDDWESETAKTVWSISLGDDYDTAVLEDIEITLTRTATNGLVTTWVINDGTAYNSNYNSYSNSSIMHLNVTDSGTITFRPDLDTIGTIADGDVFTVSISGLTKDDVSAPLTYEVDFFDLESAVEEYAPKSTVTFTVTDATNNSALTDATIQITSDATGGTVEYAQATSTYGEYTVSLKNNTTYTYSILKNHYITETGTIELAETDQTIAASMSEGSYYLYLSVTCNDTSIDGATVTIDGVSYATDYFKYAIYSYSESEINETVSYSVNVDEYSTATGEITLTVPSSGNTNFQTISLNAYSYVNFVVTDNGVPVDGANIAITTLNSGTSSGTTNANGEKTFTWTALTTATHSYTITSGNASQTGSFTITAYTPETQTFYVDLTAGALTAVTDFDLTSYVTTPVVGATPVTTFTADQYTGTVTWSGNPTVFEADTVYTATVTLTASAGYTLTDIAANCFTHKYADLIVNNADSSKVFIMFPAMTEKELTAIKITTAPTTTTYTYGDDFNITGMVVTATYDDNSTEIVTDYTVTDGDDLAVDTESVTISYGGKTTTQAITVSKATPTITLADATYTYGNGAFTLAATATSNAGDVTYVSSNSGVISITETTATVVGVGTVTITATVGGNGNYNSASTTATITVSAATITDNTTQTQTATYTGEAINIAAACGTLVNGTAAATVTYDVDTQTSYTNAGTYTIGYTLSGDNHTNVTGIITFTIAKATYTGTTTATGSAKYANSGTVDLSAWADLADASFGELTVTDADGVLATDSTPTITDGTLTFAFADDVNNVDKTVSITVPVTSTNYADFNIVITLTVADKDAPTLTATDYSKTYDSDAITIDNIAGKTATFNGADVAGTWAFADSTTAIQDVADSGTYTLVFTPTDTATYATATTTVVIAIEKASTSVTTAPTASGITYGDTLATSTLSGGNANVDGTFAWADSSIAPVVSDSLTTTYSVIFTPTDSDNYSSTTTTVTASVAKADQTIYMETITGKVYGDVDFELSASVSVGDGTVSYCSSNTSVLTIVDTTATIVGAGNTTITATVAATDNYNAASFNLDVTIAKADRSITLDTIGEKSYDDGSFALSASCSAGTGTITYSSDNADVISISGSTATINKAGEATITVTIAADDNYNSATASEKVTVNKASQTLTLTPIAEKTYGDASFELSTDAITGTGAVTYESSDTSVISISGTTATIVGAGTATITATIAADDFYAEATASQEVTVDKANDALVMTPQQYQFDYHEFTGYTASSTSGTAASITYCTSEEGTYTDTVPTDAGSYWVNVTLADSDNYYGTSTTFEFTIDKIAYPSTSATTATGSAKYANSGTVDLSAWADLAGASFGELTVTDADGVLATDSTPTITDSTLTFAFADDVNNVDKTVSITVPVTSTNYTDFELTITLTVEAKYVAEVSAESFSKAYDGNEVSTSNLTTTATYGGEDVAGTWAFAEDTSTIKDVIADTIYTLVFTPDNGDDYATVTTTVSIRITQAAIVIAADAQEITVGYELPNFTYTVTGLADGELLISEPTIRCDAQDGNTIGSYAITVADAVASDNYIISYTAATLTVNDKVTPEISIDSIGDKTYGDSAITLSTAGYAGTSAIAYTSSNHAVIAIDGTTATIVGAGETTITVTIAEDADYKAATATAAVTVSPATITITADNQSAYTGDSVPSYTYTVAGLIGDDTLIATPSAVTCPSADMATSGSYTITVSQDAEASDNYTIVYVDGTLTITAIPVSDNSDSSDDSSSSSSSSSSDNTSDVTVSTTDTTTTATPTATPNATTSTQSNDTTAAQPVIVSVAVDAVTAESGETTVDVSDEVIGNAIAQAVSSAAESGATEKQVTLAVATDTSATDAPTNIALLLSNDSVAALVDAEITQLVIESASIRITLDTATLQTVAKNTGGTISIVATDITSNASFNEETTTTIGGNPVYQFAIVDENGNAVSDFNGGVITISIPYTLGEGEQAENIVVYYVDENGALAQSMDTTYDTATKLATFSTTHFSSFAIVHLASEAQQDAQTDTPADTNSDNAQSATQDTTTTQGNNGNTMTIVAVLFFVILVGGGVYIVLKKRSQDD